MYHHNKVVFEVQCKLLFDTKKTVLPINGKKDYEVALNEMGSAMVAEKSQSVSNGLRQE